MSKASHVTFPLEMKPEPVEAGVYYFRGKRSAEPDAADFEGWVEYSSSSVWFFGNEQAFTLEDFSGEWFGPFEMEFVD